MSKTSLTILLVTLALSLIVPTVSGISPLQQQAKAAQIHHSVTLGVGQVVHLMMRIKVYPPPVTEEMGASHVVHVRVIAHLREKQAVPGIIIILIIHTTATAEVGAGYSTVVTT